MTGGLRLSVVLVVDSWETGVEVVDALRRQTIAPQIEVVIVGPGIVAPPASGYGLAGLLVTESPIDPLSAARARGIAAASAPVVFVAETHGFPRPDCLERLEQALEGGAVAAMPRIANANPRTARSWASLHATYGAFTGDRPGPAPYVALHNGAFRRSFLAGVAERPVDLVYGVGITDSIVRSHFEAVFVPEAVVDHLNVERLRGVVVDRIAGGRLWAGLRSRTWSRSRRAIYAALFPFGAAVMLGRVLRSDGWRASRGSRPPAATALVAVWAMLQSIGEAVGYIAGVGCGEQLHLPLELHRRDYVL